MKLMSADKFSNKSKISITISIEYTNTERTLGVQTFENGDVYTGAFL